MTDLYASWVRAQEQMLAMHKAQLEAATRAMGVSEHFVGAAKAARGVAEAQAKAWESWMALWGFRR